MEKHCPQCNTVNSNDAKFCCHCGEGLEMTALTNEVSIDKNINSDYTQSLGRNKLVKIILSGLILILIAVVGAELLGNTDTAYISTVQTTQISENETLGERVKSALLLEGGKNAKVEQIKWTVVEENRKGKLIEARLNKKIWVEIQTYQRDNMVHIDRGDVILHNKNRSDFYILF